VFAVQNRISLIQPSREEELFKYITGIVKNHKHKMIAINGMPDHTHLFVGLHPTQSISSLMQVVKGESSECPPAGRAGINSKRFIKGKFQWQACLPEGSSARRQEGYGAFSYGHSQVSQVYNYVMNQKKHHMKRTFLDEYRELLEKFEVPFDERYIFKPIE
jgi:REP element-mobilizing transposase RayT